MTQQLARLPGRLTLARVRHFAVLLAVILPAATHAQATVQSAAEFKFAAYPLRPLDTVIDEGRTMAPTETEGIEIIIGTPKMSFDAVLDAQPWPCNTRLLFVAFNTQRYPVDSLPPISTCVGLRSARGDRVLAFVQDAVAPHIPKEMRIGDPLRAYVMYIYFDNRRKLPFFLMNGFQAKNGQ